MSEIKISVIIPTFNSSKTIVRLIHSLSNQIFRDFEIIFIDDHSSDNTVNAIVKTLENTNMKYQLHINESNRGPGYSRNRGIEKANGEYLVFIDSDDVVREDHLSTFYNNINDHDSVFIKGLKVDSKDKLFDFRVEQFDPIMDLSRKNKSIIKATDIIELEFLMKIPFSFAFLFYKKDILSNKGIEFNEEYRYAEDTEFAIRYLVNCNDVRVVDKYTYYYYQEGGSIRQSISLKRFESVHLAEGLQTYFNELSKGNPIFDKLGDKLVHYRIPKFIFGNMNYFFYMDYDKDEVFKKMEELDLFDKLKDFKTFSKGDWTFKLKVVLFSLSPNWYYKLWKRFKNSL